VASIGVLWRSEFVDYARAMLVIFGVFYRGLVTSLEKSDQELART
jgi:hypothetical protein